MYSIRVRTRKHEAYFTTRYVYKKICGVYYSFRSKPVFNKTKFEIVRLEEAQEIMNRYYTMKYLSPYTTGRSFDFKTPTFDTIIVTNFEHQYPDLDIYCGDRKIPYEPQIVLNLVLERWVETAITYDGNFMRFLKECDIKPNERFLCFSVSRKAKQFVGKPNTWVTPATEDELALIRLVDRKLTFLDFKEIITEMKPVRRGKYRTVTKKILGNYTKTI
jgi:hypothetical protein